MTTAVDSYRLEMLRRLELENGALRRHRERLERLLGIVLEVAVAGTGVEPLALLDAIEAVDARVQEPPAEDVVHVLRETA